MQRGDLIRPIGKAKVFFRGVPFGMIVTDGRPADSTYNREGILIYSVLIDGGIAFLFEDEIEPMEADSAGG